MITSFIYKPIKSLNKSFAFIILLILMLVCLKQTSAGDVSTSAGKIYQGILKTGIVAVGSETTGVTLTTKNDGVYELELKNPELEKKADSLNGTNVVVTGDYKPRPGVEIKERRIIEVKSLTAAK